MYFQIPSIIAISSQYTKNFMLLQDRFFEVPFPNNKKKNWKYNGIIG